MGKTIIYRPDANRTLTREEAKMLEDLKGRPVVVDEDSPELTPAAEAALKEVRRRKLIASHRLEKAEYAKPNGGSLHPVTVYLSKESIERADALDEDGSALMSRLLTDALQALDTRRNHDS